MTTPAGSRESWHLTKGVSVAHLLSTIALLGAFIGYATSQENRATKVEVTAESNVKKIEEVKTDLADDIRRVEEAVGKLAKEQREDNQRVNDKLDKVIQKLD